MTRLLARCLALAALAAAVAACGVPLQAEPEAIDLEIRPVDVPSAADPIGPIQGIVYLVRDGALVPVARESAGSPEATLALLLEGPTPAEERDGLRSAIPPNTEVLALEVVQDVTIVDVSEAFAGIGGSEEILAVGQIVLTLAPGAVRGVAISLAGAPVAIPLPNGALTTDPVSFDDYAALLEG